MKLDAARQSGATIENPVAYCKRIVFRHCVDLHRQARRQNTHSMEEIEKLGDRGAVIDRPAEVDSAARAVAAWGERLRGALDRADWPPPGVVHYRAILLLALRVALLEGVAKGGGEIEPGVPVVERMLPWRSEEQGFALRAESPVELSQIWSAIVEHRKERGSPLRVNDICEIVNTLDTGAPALNTSLYRQWILRSKKLGKELIDAEEWSRAFAGLLPDVRGRARSPQGVPS